MLWYVLLPDKFRIIPCGCETLYISVYQTRNGVMFWMFPVQDFLMCLNEIDIGIDFFVQLGRDRWIRVFIMFFGIPIIHDVITILHGSDSAGNDCLFPGYLMTVFSSKFGDVLCLVSG